MKHAFLFIHLLVLTLIAYLGVGIMYKNFNFSPGHGKSGPAGTVDRSTTTPRKAPDLTPEKRQQTITRRNLFNVSTQDKTLVTDTHSLEQTLEKTDLKLALWGTVTGEPMGSSYAVIEDKKTKKQSLFQVGDAVQGAAIKQIMRNKIILTLDGRDQILEVEPRKRPAGRNFQNNLKALPNQNLTNGDPLEISQQPFGDASILKQVKIRPYFKNGKPNGLLLYGIKPGSPFQKLGLRNGDIVQQLNGEETLTTQDVQTIYQDMGATPEIEFVVRRQGKTKEILYNGQTNSYTVEDYSNE